MTFSKEFDLLKKFVALANNNPNEHEANVAARRVCVMLEKHQFAFVQQVQEPKSNPYQRPSYEPRPAYTRRPPSGYPFNDFYDAFYGSNPWWYERDPKEAKIPEEWIFEPQTNTYFNNRTGIRISALEYEYNKRRSREPNRYGDWEPKGWPGENPFKTASQQKEERDLKCKTCKKVVKTKFVGLAEVFECNTCQWTAYEARNKGR